MATDITPWYRARQRSNEDATNHDPIIAFGLRWWWLLLIGVLLGATGAVAYSIAGPGAYQSTALVQIPAPEQDDPRIGAEMARSATLNFAAEASSDRTFALVSEELTEIPGISVAELQEMYQRGDIIISAPRDANFIRFSVIDEDPERARYIANTFTTVFVEDGIMRSKASFDQRQQELEDQIGFTRENLISSSLAQREQDIQETIRDQRGLLLTLQATYQQELGRQTQLRDTTRRASPGVEDASKELQEAISAQIADVMTNLDDLNAELDSVQSQLEARSTESDPSVSAAFTSAYSTQLTSLTEEYVTRQIESVTSSPPLIRYGEASSAVALQSIKKLGFLGVVLGGSIAAGIALLIELARKRRRASKIEFVGHPEIESLLSRLERLQALPEIGDATVASNGGARAGQR